MPKVVVDNREIDVAPGTRVIEAAEKLGIMIPRFCYHPALGAVGACRVCAVRFVDGPVKGIQMSCMVRAADGMVVSTTDEEVVDFRRHVVEWLMMNHPHDCPVCDEGGECLLQDMTISGGHGIRRYPGRKRTYTDQHLGPLIAQEMNRCIHCYRCARYYQDFTGYTDLGVLRIGNRVSYGRYTNGPLESPFAGNLADVCPTGVFTDKPARYKGRRWDTERSASICIHCSLGCHTTVSARYREIVRIEARPNRFTNGYFICDRGRYGFYYANLASRPRQATISGRTVTWNQACQHVSEKLRTVTRQSGADAIVCLGDTRSSVETHAMLLRTSREKGWRDPVFFMDVEMGATVRSAVTHLTPELSISLEQVPEADVILVVGADPINEAPMLALAIRQAHRQGARIVVVDPRPVSLPVDFLHVPVGPDDLDAWLGWLIKATISRDRAVRMGGEASSFYNACARCKPAPAHQAPMNTAVQLLRKAQRPLIVCGTSMVSRQTPGLAAGFARLLNAWNKTAGLFYLMPGANAFGAGLFTHNNGSFESLLADVEAGRVCALIVTEADPFHHYPDHQRLVRALDRLDLLVVLDYVHTAVAELADIVMPTETVFEAGGIFVNQEGRAQTAACACMGGVPISQTGAGAHPPRDYQADRGGDCLPAWLSLACLADRTCYPDGGGDRTALLQWLAETVPAFGGLSALPGLSDDGPHDSDGAADGVRLVHDKAAVERFSHFQPSSSKRDRNDDVLRLISMDWTFGTEELSSRSPCLRESAAPACLFMHESDANRLALADGDRVALEIAGGEVETTLRIRNNMAAGVVFIPRHWQLANGIAGTGTRGLRHDQIRKVL